MFCLKTEGFISFFAINVTCFDIVRLRKLVKLSRSHFFRYFKHSNIISMTFEGLVHSKQILSLITHPHVIPNQ